MALQFGVLTRNRRLDAIEIELGTTPVLTVWSGTLPANCAAANSGTKLAEMTLPSDWMNAASGGTKTYIATWSDVSADAAGTAVHFRINKTGAGTCELQGTCSNTGGGGDLKFDNDVFTAGQTVTVTAFTITDGNA